MSTCEIVIFPSTPWLELELKKLLELALKELSVLTNGMISELKTEQMRKILFRLK